MKITDVTYGGLYGPAMAIEDQEQADQYFEFLVAYQMGAIVGSKTPAEDIRELAEQNTRINLGYYAGYYDGETQARVNRLFSTTHPVFGGTRPTAKEAFEADVKWAQSE